MCSEFCKPSNKYKFYEDYELVGCENSPNNGNRREFFAQFKVVLIYERPGEKNKRMVLKSRNQFFLDADTHMDFDFKQKPVLDQLKYLLSHFKSSLQTNFGLKISQDAGTLYIFKLTLYDPKKIWRTIFFKPKFF